jgi:hypothetical protein
VGKPGSFPGGKAAGTWSLGQEYWSYTFTLPHDFITWYLINQAQGQLNLSQIKYQFLKEEEHKRPCICSEIQVLSSVITELCVTPCNPVKVDRHFEGTYRFHLQDRRVSKAWIRQFFLTSLANAL